MLEDGRAWCPRCPALYEWNGLDKVWQQTTDYYGPEVVVQAALAQFKASPSIYTNAWYALDEDGKWCPPTVSRARQWCLVGKLVALQGPFQLLEILVDVLDVLTDQDNPGQYSSEEDAAIDAAVGINDLGYAHLIEYLEEQVANFG